MSDKRTPQYYKGERGDMNGLKPIATMNFMDLNLTPSIWWHQKKQQQRVKLSFRHEANSNTWVAQCVVIVVVFLLLIHLRRRSTVS
ncbi:hypothetical protein TNCV_92761 [Trichonephila clavipes]|nr:hypothetical protein TNCV_92761 [Trichonephila clavipes]